MAPASADGEPQLGLHDALATTWQVDRSPPRSHRCGPGRHGAPEPTGLHPADFPPSRTPVLLLLPMPPLRLADLPEAIPIPYRSAEAPDGLELNSLLIPHPLSTFYMRVGGIACGAGACTTAIC